MDLRSKDIRVVAGQVTPGFSGDGGPATAAKLKLPTGLVFNENGNLFISDGFDNRVRTVDRNNSTITTIAGMGAPARDLRELDIRL